MSGEHFVWDVNPILVTVPQSWLQVIGLVVGVVLGALAARYYWRARKRGSEEDRGIANTLATVAVVGLAVAVFVKRPIEIRYYGVLFATALFCGYYIMRWQFRRGGYSDEKAESLFLYAALGIIIGARLGHIILYEPARFISNPIEIFKIWNGGLSSHGTAVGLLIALFLFHRKWKIPYVEVTDRLSMSIALCSGFIRIGNFMNSEILGRVSDVPWAIVFPRAQGVTDANMPRHPSQLYEVTMSVIVFCILYFTDRKLGERRPRGLISAMLLIGYFTLRFVVEFVKIEQADMLLGMHFPLTMGQLASLPFVLAGIAWMIFAIRKGPFTPVAQAPDGSIQAAEDRTFYRKKKRKK